MKKILQFSVWLGRITFTLEVKFVMKSLASKTIIGYHYFKMVSEIIGDVNAKQMFIHKLLKSQIN